MSRTDKDRPQWVRSLDPTEDRYVVHHHTRWVSGRGIVMVECDLSDTRRPEPWRNCAYYARGSSWYTPPSDLVSGVWWRPERMRQRSKLREIAKEYNGRDDEGDDFDADFDNYQHRHNVQWLWY